MSDKPFSKSLQNNANICKGKFRSYFQDRQINVHVIQQLFSRFFFRKISERQVKNK